MLFLRNSKLAAPLFALVTSGRGDQTNSSGSSITIGDSTKTKGSQSTAQPTCESRTVNYITHTLPQQCLTSSPPTAVPTAASEPATVVTVSPTTTSTTETASSSADSATAADVHELDSDGNDLSTGAFMSFEEWKDMMLKRSGQENLEDRPRKPQDGRGEVPGEDYGAMGEEGEISLDFDAYSDKISEITAAGKPAPAEKAAREDSVEKVQYDDNLGHVHRSKDAGKTCKERFSYSSFDAGATVLKTSPGAKNPKAILVENKDSYMLMECGSQNKFFIVELSDDVLVDTVVLANFEFFSSMVRQFRVSVSDRYPVKLDKWKVLGEFVARNSRDVQPFLIQHPQIWARYLRIEILSHYGKEFYCPLSLIRVHGTRMLDSWKEADPSDADGELEEVEESPTIAESAERPAESLEPVEVVVEETKVQEEPLPTPRTTMLEPRQSNAKSFWDPSYFHWQFQPSSTCALYEAPVAPSQTLPGENSHDRSVTPAKPKAVASAEESGTASSAAGQISSNKTTTSEAATSSAAVASNETTGTSVVKKATSESIATSVSSSPEGVSTSFEKPTSTASTKAATQSTPRSKPATASTSLKPPASKSHTPKVVSGTTSRNKTGSATSSSTSASPTVQDSFFKQLTKRLQNLESNTTLSLQYIESQSKFLQEALAKLERRHASKVDLFLDSLNKTVMTELREFRSQYDQIWQSTIIALESQREKFEHENVALSTRIGLLADEVVFQKRMAIIQSVLLLGCLVLVVFGRGIGNAGLELYYPTQFQGSFSRLAGPLYPSTPKGMNRASSKRRQNTIRESVEDSNGETPNKGLVSDSDAAVSPPRPQMAHSPEPGPRHQSQRYLSLPQDRRPSPTRAVSETTGLEFYQPPTPASLDAGYDSEPPHMPSSPKPDYFFPHTNGDYTNSRASTPGGAPATSAQGDPTQRLAAEVSGADEHVSGHEAVPPAPRIPMSSAAGIKPLPALPEDSD